MLPGPVLVMLKILAWLWVPLWVTDGAMAPELDAKTVFLVSMLALAATLAAMELHRQDRVDARIREGLEAHRRSEAEIAQLAAAAVDGGAAVEPIPQRAPDLRLVRDPAS